MAGRKPHSVKTSADVKFDRQGEGFAITDIALTAAGAGIDAEKFLGIAERRAGDLVTRLGRPRGQSKVLLARAWAPATVPAA